VLVLFATFVYLRNPLYKQVPCVVMAIILLSCLGLMKWHRTHRDHLSLTCLDVGHGQAILAQLPGTMNVLFDAGSMHASDVGARIVLPFLDYIGVSRLHAIVLSHHDIDHINGVPEIADRRQVDHVYVGDAFLAQAQTTETARLLAQHLQARGIAVDRVPEVITGSPASVELLWPAGDPNAQQQLSDNDRSLVSMIAFGGVRVLLCSDTESLAQQQIIRLYPALKADVVVAPHHGSVRTLDPGFLPQLQPRVLLCSCGRPNYDRGRVIKPDLQTEAYYTARDGAVTICIDADGAVQRHALKSK